MTSFSARGNRSAGVRWFSWPSLWRGGLLTLAIVFVLSTQLLFQLGLYESWPLAAILLGWLDHFTDQLVVGACIFAAVALAGLVPVNSTPGRIGLLAVSITLVGRAGRMAVMLRLPWLRTCRQQRCSPRRRRDGW